MTTSSTGLRPPPSQSPTSSISSLATSTPTSPYFAQTGHTARQQQQQQPLQQHQQQNHHSSQSQSQNYPYPSLRETRQQSTSSSLGTPTISTYPRPSTPPFLRPPQGQYFSSYLRTWGPEEIASFLATCKCGHYASNFQRNDIDGKVLLDLDMASLKEMGISKVGERVKLLSGIKDLRKRASGISSRGSISSLASSSRVELRLNGLSTPPLDVPALSPGLEGLSRTSSNSGVTRLQSTRPPPLDLQPHASRNLPQAYQNTGASSTPRPVQSTASRPSISSQTSSNATVTPSTSVPAPSRPSNLNLRAPPPRDLGRRSPSPINPDASGFIDRPLPPAPSQTSAAEYASSIRLAEGRSPPTWNSGDRSNAVSNSRPSAIHPAHRKNPSLSVLPGRQTSPVKNKFPGISSGRGHTSSGAIHPFASKRDDEKRVSPSHLEQQHSAGSVGSTGSGLGSHKRNPTGGYVVGAGGMHASKTASTTSTKRTGSSEPAGNTIPLEDLRRQLVKFVNSEDGTSRTVNVSSCSSGVEVLERVLKKFGKWNVGVTGSTDTESDEDGDRLEVDGWGVYAESEPDEDSKPLSEAALLGVCLSLRDGSAVPESGLTLRRARKVQHRRKNMEEFFGEAPPPPMSPTSPFSGPRLGLSTTQHRSTEHLGSPTSKNASSKKMNRASTVSIMSGLGVPMPGVEPPPSPGTQRSPSSGSFLSKSKKMYNFFGHRPPSELISNHLAEYFPSAKKKELEKTIRQSMRLSMGPGALKRISVAQGMIPQGTEAAPPLPDKRAGVIGDKLISPPRRRPLSRATITSQTPEEIIPEETEGDDIPRVSISGDDGIVRRPRVDGEIESESTNAKDGGKPPLLPPFEPSKESLAESLQAYSPAPASKRPKSILLGRRGSFGSTRSRMSMVSQLRRNRDRSDTASMLTVDEITAEVENRRASTIHFNDSDEEEDMAVAPAATDHGVAPTSEADSESGADDESESESDESESEESDESSEEDEDEEEEDDEHGKAFTSTGSKRIIKWIKGALIGAGSFGQVFLGMDAREGLLMAVKQVELPGGNTRNEERKRSMVDALEREIELLKELQHENIVQYLDSSADGNFLNIFLEYVPGGSVAALLNNYGAFEEPLVRNFSRQILMGLNYLHEREIIHRDIKGANILVDNKGGIKISDFGISRKVENNLMAGMKSHRPSLQGSVFWMAPEIVKQTSYTLKADIWSVGSVVVEMLTGNHPWAELTQMQAIFKIGSSARPATPADISPEAANLLDKTFEIDHTARPTAAELLQHPFIAKVPGSLISDSVAQATMSAAAANRGKGMQNLSALAGLR